jgi:Zn finger protein HypA/HybF involved in hydrogenase expression
MKPTGGKRCVLCRQAFAPRAKNQRYCPACAAKQKRLKAAERQRRKRASASRF